MANSVSEKILGTNTNTTAFFINSPIAAQTVASFVSSGVQELTRVAIQGGKINWVGVASSTAQAFTQAALTNAITADRQQQGNSVPVAKSCATEPAAYFAEIAPDVKALTWGGDMSAGAGGLNASNRDRPYFNGLTSTVYNSAAEAGVSLGADTMPNNNKETTAAYFRQWNRESGLPNNPSTNKVKNAAGALNDANAANAKVALSDDELAIKYAQDKFAQQQALASKEMSGRCVAANNLDGTTIGNPQSGYRRLNASDITTIYDAAADAAGKAAGANKLLPAKALQEANVKDIMSSRSLGAAQGVIKSPTAKSAMAMADAAKHLKWVPYLGKGVTAYEEGGRLLKANGMVETSNVMKAATVNYALDTGATTGGAATFAYLGAGVGSAILPGLGTIVGGVVGGVFGAFSGHYLYDDNIAPKVRVKFAGEKFRE